MDSSSGIEIRKVIVYFISVADERSGVERVECERKRGCICVIGWR